MFFMSSIGCKFNRHKPLRRDVEWDGRAYIGTCRHCGVQIMRHARRDWRKRNPEKAEDIVAAT
jgi:hypothetical protein